MSKEIEHKLNKIPILNILVKFGKKIKIPGLEGMSLYDVLEMYIIGIVEGALTTRAGGIASVSYTHLTLPTNREV